jgi:hypothetical protein
MVFLFKYFLPPYPVFCYATDKVFLCDQWRHFETESSFLWNRILLQTNAVEP